MDSEILQAWLTVQPPELQDRKVAEVVAKTLVDPEFRSELLRRPQKLFLTPVKPLADKEIVLLGHDRNTVYMVLPEPPTEAVRRVVESRLSITDKELTSGKVAFFTWNDDIDIRRERDSKSSDWRGYPFNDRFGDGFVDFLPNRDPIGDPDSRD